MNPASEYSSQDLAYLLGDTYILPYMFTVLDPETHTQGDFAGLLYREDAHFITVAAFTSVHEDGDLDFVGDSPVIKINKTLIRYIRPVCGAFEEEYLTFLVKRLPELDFQGRLGAELITELEARLQELEVIKYTKEVDGLFETLMKEQANEGEEGEEEEDAPEQLDLDLEHLVMTNPKVSMFRKPVKEKDKED